MAADITGEEEEDFLAAILEYPMDLEYAHVKAKARAVMALRKKKGDSGVEKTYRKQMIVGDTFPTHHLYVGITKMKPLIEKLEKRNAAGRDVEIHTWYSVKAMKNQLLKDEGAEVSSCFSHSKKGVKRW